MFILDTWIWIPTGQTKAEECSDLVQQRRVALVMCLYVRCLMHNKGKNLGDEREVCALDEGVEVEKEMECEDEELVGESEDRL